ncbi:MAG: hypothetical protein CMH22_05595 [Methylophaga sp.]|nr:hypothetical protein [Methylophaga sp.]|tara:strand:+ start:108098 stop:108535 length:438 start_codon:yes stop_codon:yes gene_type:complete
MTHSEIVKISAKWLKKHNKNILVPNCPTVLSEFSSATVTGEIPDIIGFCSWASVLIEVKTSRSDFLADKKKKFRKNCELGVGEFRYFCCTENLISVRELPSNWGLLYLIDDKIEIIQKAVKQTANLNCERTLLLSLIRRNEITTK